jgi:hypothetical protein
MWLGTVFTQEFNLSVELKREKRGREAKAILQATIVRKEVCELKESLLNRIQGSDSERVDDEGEKEAATFDGKRLR